MKVKTADGKDIVTDSEDINVDQNAVQDDEGGAPTGDVNIDSREAIADRLEAGRAERNDFEEEGELEGGEISSDDDDDDDDDDADEVVIEPEEGEADSEDIVTLVVDGEEKKLTQKELIDNAQLFYGSRKKMTEAAELTKKLTEGLSELAALRAQVVKQPTVNTPGKQAAKPNFDPADFVTKLREGTDAEALAAVESFSKTFGAGEVEVPDVNAAIDERLSQIEADKRENERQAANDAFDAAEAAFKENFKADIDSSPDFFELAAMEDRKLAADPAWKTKPVEDRLTEAGTRARAWLDPASASEKRRQDLKSRHVPRKAASKRVVISKDDAPDTPSSIIADMKASRGQLA